jgi:beta-xylosidase
MSFSKMASLLLASSVLRCLSLVPPAIQKPPLVEPLMQENFPDPAIIEVESIFYAFSTTSSGAHVPVAISTDDMKSMTYLNDNKGNVLDAMPSLPPWTPANNSNVWAPDVIQIGTHFVLYFSAISNDDESRHCVGAATSTSVTGPYTPVSVPIACPTKQGGAIDPAGFTDQDGKTYVVYKVDGNSLGGGGPCGNENGQYPTPLMLQQVSSDGFTPIDEPIILLNRSNADGPYIEAPSLVRSSEGVYVLFFSSNCYNGPYYDTSYATAMNVRGQFTKSAKPLLVTGTEGLFSPGGADVLADGSRIVFHADQEYSNSAVRQVYTSEIQMSGTTVSLAVSGSSASQ